VVAALEEVRLDQEEVRLDLEEVRLDQEEVRLDPEQVVLELADQEEQVDHLDNCNSKGFFFCKHCRDGLRIRFFFEM
jgi:hypothetical protein